MILNQNTYMDVYNIHEYMQEGKQEKDHHKIEQKNLFIYIQSLFALPTITVQSQKYFLFYFFSSYHLSNVVIFAKKYNISTCLCIFCEAIQKGKEIFISLLFAFRSYYSFLYLFHALFIHTYFPLLLLKTNFLKKYLFCQHPKHKKNAMRIWRSERE